LRIVKAESANLQLLERSRARAMDALEVLDPLF
jgi:hypothetical protein